MYTADGGYAGRNNIIYDNVATTDPEYFGTININYSCCPQTLTGIGNITNDPWFVDPLNDDFNLQAGSPCIDAGDPASPLDPDSTVADMGALYYDQIVGVEIENESAYITEFTLLDAYPNPFNPTTMLSFALPQAERVNLKVYSPTGALVATLVDGWRDAGSHEVTFDASGLTSGVYVYRLNAGEFNASGKMILMK